MGPPPPVAEVRGHVRRAVADLPEGSCVVVAVSGGPDSVALLAAALFELPRRGLGVGAVTVDHGLQPGSARRARALARAATAAGADPVEVAHVRVGDAPGTDRRPGPGNVEAEARTARRRVLEGAANRWSASAILLAHTRDDQAETVLLGLTRGSGARSLAGMARLSGPYRRPLLGVARDVVHEAARQSGFDVWHDPHNADLRFARARARRGVLPAMERDLGPGVAEALARTAEMLAEDAEALEKWAERSSLDVLGPEGAQVQAALALPRAVRLRVLRRFLIQNGVPAGDLTRHHVTAVEELVVAWRGQRWVDLPGGRRARRRDGHVVVTVAG